MNDGALLHRAILNNPLDRVVRLAYADWLDENATCEADRARAAFIRLMIDWDNGWHWWPWLSDDEVQIDLHKRAHALLRAHEREWLPPWWPWRRGRAGRPGRPAWNPFWERGFVENVRIGRTNLLRYRARLFAVMPIVAIRFNPYGEPPPDLHLDRDNFMWSSNEADLALAWARERAGLQPVPPPMPPNPAKRPWARLYECPLDPSARWPWLRPGTA